MLNGLLVWLCVKRLSWRSILQRLEGRRIVGLWYGLDDGYLRIELDDGSVLVVVASWEGCHVMVDVPRSTASLMASQLPVKLKVTPASETLHELVPLRRFGGLPEMVPSY